MTQVSEHRLVRELREQLPKPLSLSVKALLDEINMKLVEPPELWGATDVAEYLGIRSQNLYKLLDRDQDPLPKPVSHPARGMQWDPDEIKAYKTKKEV